MDKQAFLLKPSILALVFQVMVFIFVGALLFQLLAFWLWLIAILFAVLSYAWCMRRPPEVHFQHLDEREWTLTAKQQQVKHVQISHVIDHQIYIVVYFQHFQEKPLLIWCDQVSWQEWKRLKILAKLV